MNPLASTALLVPDSVCRDSHPAPSIKTSSGRTGRMHTPHVVSELSLAARFASVSRRMTRENRGQIVSAVAHVAPVSSHPSLHSRLFRFTSQRHRRAAALRPGGQRPTRACLVAATWSNGWMVLGRRQGFSLRRAFSRRQGYGPQGPATLGSISAADRDSATCNVIRYLWLG